MLTLIRYHRLFHRYVGARLYAYVGIILLGGVTEGLGITLFLPLIERVTGDDAGSGVVGRVIHRVLTALGLTPSLTSVLLLILGTVVLTMLVRLVQERLVAGIMADLARDLRLRLVDAYAKLDYRDYIERTVGQFSTVLTREAELFVAGFAHYAAILAAGAHTAVFALTAVLIDWHLTAVTLAAGAGLLTGLRHLGRVARRYSLLASEGHAELQQQAIQFVQHFKYLRATGTKEPMLRRLHRQIASLADYRLKDSLAGGVLRALSEPAAAAVVVALLFVYLVVLGKPFAGVVVTIMLFYRLVQKVLQMQHGWQAFSSCLGGIQTYDRTFAEVSSRPERAGWRAIGGLQHGIELQDVSLRLGETMVLADVSLAIPRRQAVALVGESGAGKTSVVDLVTGVLKPTSGRVLVDGVDLGEIDLAAWRRRIGYVTQETVVFNDTLANNITLWAESSPETEGRLQAAVQATGLAEVAAAERGLDTVVGDRGIKLSGGQRQRLAIARELFRQPDLLILDEATSALDAETERGVRDHIEALRGRVTLLVIGHRLETIRNCDWIYVLSKGTVVESGPFARLVEDRSSYLHQCAGEMDS